MRETIEWLRQRPYYDGQITEQRSIDERAASFDEALSLDRRLAGALEADGIEKLYAHQAAAIRGLRSGENIVLSTETASGKSLAYTIPAFERAMGQPSATTDGSPSHGSRHRQTTLYVAPQVALINDQTETLSELADRLGFGSGVAVAQYTGRQSRAEKAQIRDRQPTVLLTTPDMLHYGILPHAHRLWDWFFRRLSTVIVDEVHAYRGVFGSHVSLVCRRLNRLCERFEADPQWMCCSATIANPVDHASTLTGQPAASFDAIDHDESARGPREWLLWNPPEQADGSGMGRRRSSHVEAKRLFVDLVSRDLQTLVFCGSRQAAERYATDSADALRAAGEHAAAGTVAAYQATLPTERRREIEAGLQDGSTRGVWTTSAMELGVDIGGLDCVILDGYPGTRMSTFQRAGRAGRGMDPALVVLIAGEDQLDQYIMGNPASLFEDPPERAITNPTNEEILPDHVRSAAAENWLSTSDERWFGAPFPGLVDHLESTGELRRRSTRQGTRWTTDGAPQQGVSLRTIDDDPIQLVDQRGEETLATLPFDDALRDAHRGAIYHHQGRTYEVAELNLSSRVASLNPTWADYFTSTLHDKTISIERALESSSLESRPDVTVTFAELTMRQQITGFRRQDSRSGAALGEESLTLPETTLRTKGLYFTLPPDLEATCRAHAGEFNGGIHAAEHAMISMLPTMVLCDRRDIGGVSTPLHPQTGRSTIFIYDGYPGGVGLTRAGYESIERLIETTLRMLEACPCESGCPACVQSPHCGNANDPLDKAVARLLLEELR